MGRLRIVLVSVALLAGLAFAAPVRADEVTEDLPWWARPDYEEYAAEIAAGTPAVAAAPDPALPEPADTLAEQDWWAGGPDAVLVLKGGEAPSDEPPDELAEESGSSSDAGEEDDGGRNPLHRAEGHRAGEDPSGTSGEADPEEQLEERRDKDGANECRRLPNQIERYKKQLDEVGSRASPRARAALETHIERLEARRQYRCPEPPGPDYVLITLKVLVKAAKIASRVARYMYGSPF